MSPLSAKSRSSSLMNSSSYSVSPTKPQYCLILLFGRITISRPLVKTSRFSVPSFVRRLLGIRRPSSTITASIMIRSYYVLFTLMICGLWRFVRRTIDTVKKSHWSAYPLPASLPRWPGPSGRPEPAAAPPPARARPRPSPAPRISAADCHVAPRQAPARQQARSRERVAE